MEHADFLQEQQARLADVLRPYQREVNRQQRVAEFINTCMRSAARNDFFRSTSCCTVARAAR
jgi:hypothetical protein